MAETKLMIPAQLTSYRPKSDFSFSITFSTLVLRDDQREIIHSLFQRNCVLLMKSGDVDKDDEAVMDSVDMDLYDNRKTPSQRMRNVMYRIWENNGKCDIDGVECTFKSYYDQRMANMIEVLKVEMQH